MNGNVPVCQNGFDECEKEPQAVRGSFFLEKVQTIPGKIVQSIVFPVLRRRHMLQFFKTAGVGQGVFEPHAVCHRRNRQLGVAEQLFRFVDPVFGDILMDGHTHMIFEKFAEIIFGKADTFADRINVQISGIVFLNEFNGCVDGAVLYRSQIFGFQDVYRHFVQIHEELVDQGTCLHLCQEGAVVVVDGQQGQEMIQDTAELVGMIDAVAFADEIIILLGMGASDDYINEILDMAAGLDKSQGCITGGHDHIMGIDCIPLFVF